MHHQTDVDKERPSEQISMEDACRKCILRARKSSNVLQNGFRWRPLMGKCILKAGNGSKGTQNEF